MNENERKWMKMNENEMYENSSFVFAAQDNNILAALTNIFNDQMWYNVFSFN